MPRASHLFVSARRASARFCQLQRCLSTSTNAEKYLTPKRREVIAVTAEAVANNVHKITPIFYATMFKNNPEVMAFFNRANQVNRAQPAALAHAVLASVGHLDNMEAIADAANLIAHKHCALGVLAEHYPIVHDNFLAATAQVLGDAVTADVADAWSGVLQYLAQHFIDLEANLYAQSTARNEDWDARTPKNFVVRGRSLDAENLVSLFLEREDGKAAPAFKPGQYLTVCNNPTSEALFAPRHYTIATPEVSNNCLRICVKRVGGGSTGNPPGIMSNYLHTVGVGDVLSIRPPFGVFTTDNAQRFSSVAYVTAGCGITPALAMLSPLVQQGKKVVHLHVDSAPSSVPLVDELASIKVHQSIRVYDQGCQTMVTPAVIAAKLNEAGLDLTDPNTCTFVCAPPSMISAVCRGLVEQGVSPSSLVYENFGPRSSF
mmetsp:Transcript_20440/g.47793  ORF Transcript_20440/g.47793 Transcript_20440/m.47793 type:complete len:432 (-) Transcript_20440:159-1454(-)|eukprot:CAMPEP_0114553766 /NCGR_PEP_ID=MMETSP0114-20121206/7845_1 /TAXON_ID=31324 /ORGANISM="Goniomonas sp, Strain m" /LENGTH=431 /DNA_ID=CAMNT_0001738755 /DNA_START=67 /DNA_END=1362 /DNA_ORIENTATION=+